MTTFGKSLISNLMKLLLIFTSLLAATLLFGQPDPTMPEGKYGVDYNAVNADGLRTGPWIRVYEDGSMYYKGQFDSGSPTGTFWFWYDTGEPMSKVDHLDGTAHMEVVNYHKSGFPMSKGTYRERITQDTTLKVRDGEWEFFNEEGVLKSRESYQMGLKQGPSIDYFDTGKVLKEVIFEDDKENGPWTEYYDNGRVRGKGAYKQGELDGKFELFRPGGTPIVKGEYTNGLKNGIWINFNEDGSIRITTKYENGAEVSTRRENGEFTDYYDSGIPSATYNYEDGVKNGPFTEYYDQGEWVKVPMDEPQPGGGIQYKEKLSGTQVQREGDYLDGKLEGPVTYYNEDGRIMKTEYYVEGELESTEER
jgi:antitoxin component YwqK of YwqJK toxin-antitoxin module